MSNTKTAPTPAHEPTSVLGYLAENWPDLNDATPAVVLNPDARPMDLLAWCWAELKSLEAAANVVTFNGNRDDINKGDFDALFLYRLYPLVRVYDVAMQQLKSSAIHCQSEGRES